MRDGSHAGTFVTSQTTSDAIVRAMVGREPPVRLSRPLADATAPPVLSVRNQSRGRKFHDVSLDVRPGEIVGLFGLVGSGRTEVLETLFGIAQPTQGAVHLRGKPIVLRSAREASRAGIALVPEDRQRLGLHYNLNIRHNLSLAAGARLAFGRIDTRAEIRAAEEMAASLALRMPSLRHEPDALSGGNQQKCVAGKWLTTSPVVLLLDEPTKGVDVGAKFEIHNLIRARAAEGMACLVVSSDLPEVLALADRILVMREGRLRGELPGTTATEENVMALATHDEAVGA
jgi:ABC-type sugar transport system ATPase subunit